MLTEVNFQNKSIDLLCNKTMDSVIFLDGKGGGCGGSPAVFKSVLTSMTGNQRFNCQTESCPEISVFYMCVFV